MGTYEPKARLDVARKGFVLTKITLQEDQVKKWRVTWQAPAHPKPRSEDFDEEEGADKAVGQLKRDGEKKRVRWVVSPHKKEIK